MALPDFLVIGAPKAGSTAVHEALVQHPQLFLSTPKEPKHFMTGGTRPRRAHQRGPGDAHSAREWVWQRERYEALFDRRAGRHAARREHAVLPLGQGGAPAHPRRDAGRQAHRDHQRPCRPRVLELDAPVVRRARTRGGLRHRVPRGTDAHRRRLRAVLALPRARQVRRAVRAPVPRLRPRAGARAALQGPRGRAGQEHRLDLRVPRRRGRRRRHDPALEPVRLGRRRHDQHRAAGRRARRRRARLVVPAAGLAARARSADQGAAPQQDATARTFRSSSAANSSATSATTSACSRSCCGQPYHDWLSDSGRGTYAVRKS